MRTAAFLLLLVLAGCSWFQDCVRTAGPVSTLNRAVPTQFTTEISNLRPRPWHLLVGGYNSLTISKRVLAGQYEVYGGENLINQSALNTRSDTLLPEYQVLCDAGRGWGSFLEWRFHNHSHWRSIRWRSGGTLMAADTLALDTFRIDHYGAGNVELMLNTKWFITDLNSGGKMKLMGRTSHFQVFTHRYNQLDASQLEADSVYVYARGDADITIRANGLLYVEIDGNGSIRYLGNPQVIQVYKSGLGRVVPAQ